jgi:hypothetical protein
MKVYIVYKEFLNWKEFNGAEIIGVFSMSENAKECFEKKYQEEMEYLEESQYKIVTAKTGKHFAEISTVYGDVNIYLVEKEVQ